MEWSINIYIEKSLFTLEFFQMFVRFTIMKKTLFTSFLTFISGHYLPSSSWSGAQFLCKAKVWSCTARRPVLQPDIDLRWSINDCDYNTLKPTLSLCLSVQKESETRARPAVAYPFPACSLHRSDEEDTGGDLEQCHHQYSNRTQTACLRRQELDLPGVGGACQMAFCSSWFHGPLS